MTKRTVKHALARVPHGPEDGQHPDLPFGFTYSYAYRGDTLDLRPEQEKELDKNGALYSKDEAKEAGYVDQHDSLDDLVKDSSLDEHVHRTSVKDLVSEVGSDPISAERVIAAERRVQNRNPRADLLKKLDKVAKNESDGPGEEFLTEPNLEPNALKPGDVDIAFRGDV